MITRKLPHVQIVSMLLIEALLAIVIGYPNPSALRAPIIIAAFFWTLFRKGTILNLRLFSVSQLFWSNGILFMVLLSRIWAINPQGIDDVWLNVLWCAMISFTMFDYVVTYRITVQEITSHLIPIVLILLVNLLLNGSTEKSRVSVSVNANTFGEICVGMLHYFLYLWWTQKRNKIRNLGIVLLLAAMTLLSGSRKSAFALVIFFIGYYQFKHSSLFSRKKLIRSAVTVGILALAYCLIMYVDVLYQTVGNRIESLFLFALSGLNPKASGVDPSIFSRTNMIRISSSFFIKHPLLGIGANNFKYNSYYGTYSHNGYMEILCGLGLIGFSVYYLPVVVFLKKAIKNWRLDVPDAIVPLCVVIAFLILEVGRVTYFSYQSYCLLSIAMGMIHNMSQTRHFARRLSPARLGGKAR